MRGQSSCGPRGPPTRSVGSEGVLRGRHPQGLIVLSTLKFTDHLAGDDEIDSVDLKRLGNRELVERVKME